MKEALKQALEALKETALYLSWHQELHGVGIMDHQAVRSTRAAIAAAEAALAEPASIAEQAPVAWMYEHCSGDIKPILERKPWPNVPCDWEEVPLYAETTKP